MFGRGLVFRQGLVFGRGLVFERGLVFRQGLLPSLHHRKEGWPSDQIKYCEASDVREAGVVFRSIRKENHPVCARLRSLRGIFFLAQPPLLAVMQGGE